MEQYPETSQQRPPAGHAAPQPAQRLIARPRLTRLLDGAKDRKLTLISAPAGFGKTTLVAAWLQTLTPGVPRVAWLTLDGDDNHPLRFWHHALLALSVCDRKLAEESLHHLQSASGPPEVEYLLTRLINRIAGSSASYLLIVDDYHVITDPAVHRSLQLLLAYIPPQLNLMLLSRTEPPLPLADLRARGQALEIRTEELRCTAEEAVAFLGDVMGVVLTPALLDELYRHTEGWLLGLQLAGLSLQGQSDPAVTIAELRDSTRPALDFLTEQVFRRQPPDLRAFLRDTAILERLCAPLCDAVTQMAGSHERLEQIVRANLFLVALDGQRRWYRYHQLFAAALRERLDREPPAYIRGLHSRASAWYAAHGEVESAINHALSAEEWERAADLIEQAAHTFTWATGTREGLRQQRWLRRIPERMVWARPRLCFAFARSLYTSAPTARIERWLQLAERAAANSPASAEQRNLLGEITGYRAYLDMMRGDGRQAAALCEAALPLLAEQNRAARADVIYTLAVTSIYEGQGATGAAALLEAANLIASIGDVWSAVLWRSLAGAWLAFQGRLREAWHLLEQALELARDSRGETLPTAGYALCFQADLLREWNRLDEAFDAITRAYAFRELTHSPLFVIISQPVLARILWARGHLAGAYAAIQRLDDVPAHWRRARALYALNDQVRIWLAVGAAARLNETMRELDAEHDSMPLPHAYEELARVAVLLSRGDTEQALAVLAPLLASAEVQGRERQLIQGQLLEVLAHEQGGNRDAALSVLAAAIRLGEREGYIRSFVDSGAPIHALLVSLRDHHPARVPRPYLDRLLAACPPERMVQ